MTPFIVAELSGNHLGDFDRALALVEVAAWAGANAIKTQCYEPEQMADEGIVIQGGPWAGGFLQGLYRECYTPKAWHAPLFSRAKELGMEAFSSVFHKDDVDFLETLGCPRYKISSFEILDLELIQHAVSTGKPIIVSTGMASVDEIDWASFATRKCSDRTLLKCTSSYPTPLSDANLATMQHLRDTFQRWKVGISDHTLGLVVPVAATALGASMIEKHLCLSRSDGGHDAAFSSEPHEFAAMVKACREAAAALGEVRYGPTPSEMSSLPLRRLKGGKRGSV